ncbi:MAG: RHS repeat protein, partial [Bacteroidetes bacterium]
MPVRADGSESYWLDTDYLAAANLAPGIPEGSVFAGFEENESVSLVTGNLLVTHATTPAYPLSELLDARLARTYNSKIAGHDKIEVWWGDVCGPGSDIEPPPAPPECEYWYNKEGCLIRGRSWIGFGWKLQFGRIYEHPRAAEKRAVHFEDSRGTRHQLRVGERGGAYQDLRPEAAVISYRKITQDSREITLPDGTTWLFSRPVAQQVAYHGWITNHDRAGWYATTITDVLGNRVFVSYHDGNFPEAIAKVEIQRLGEARVTVIETETWQAGDPGFVSWTAGMLKVLRARNATGGWSTYRYEYELVDVEEYEYESTSRRATRSIPVLARVILPSGDRIEYEYGYTPGPGCFGVPRLTRIVYPTGGVSTYEYRGFRSGNREYSDCPYPVWYNGPDFGIDPAVCWEWTKRYSVGISKRVVYPEGDEDHDGSLNDRSYKWTWDRAFHDAQAVVDDGHHFEEDAENSFLLTHPDGRREEVTIHGNGFGTCHFSPADERCLFDYERTRTIYDVGDPDSTADDVAIRYEERTWDWRSVESDPTIGDNVLMAVLPAQMDVWYLDDDQSDGQACFEQGEVVPVGERTGKAAYDRTTLTDRRADDFKNLKRFASTYRSEAAGVLETYSRRENSGDDPESARIADHHVYGSVLYRIVQDAQARWEMHRTYEDDGRVKSSWANRDYVQSKADDWTNLEPATAGCVTHAAIYDANERLSGIRYYGGDAPRDPGDGVLTAPGCTEGESAAQYEVEYSWENGRPHRVKVLGLANDYFVRDFSVNAYGFVTTSRDPHGVETTFSYDDLNRLTQVAPPQGTVFGTWIDYPTSREAVIERAVGATGTFDAQNPDQVYRKLFFDGLARTRRIEKAHADGTLVVQEIARDESGREVFRSEWMEKSAWESAARQTWSRGEYSVTVPLTGTGVPWGTVTYYGTRIDDTAVSASEADNPLTVRPDALGRVRRVETVDGTVTTLRYCGRHVETTVRDVAAGAAGARRAVVKRDYRDAADRIVYVDEDARGASVGEIDPGADAAYEYDLRGNLVKVLLFAPEQTPDDPFKAWREGTLLAAQQEREFEFDALGRLRKERMPEQAPRVAAWDRVYSAYDVWGNLVQWQDAIGQDRGHAYRNHYDAAGRLTRRERIVVADGGSWSKGATPASPGDWTVAGFSTAYSAACLGEADAWYTGDADCQYDADAPVEYSLTSGTLTGVPEGATIYLELWRELRWTGRDGSPVDALRILVKTPADTWESGASEIFRLDSRAISWSTWRNTVSVPLPVAELGDTLEIRVELASVTAPSSSNVRGLGKSRVAVERPAKLVLEEHSYDESLGLAGNKPLGKRTRSLTYDASSWHAGVQTPTHTQEWHYVDIMGRLSGEELALVWLRTGSAKKFEAIYTWDELDRLAAQTMPHPVGAVAVAEYHYRFARESLVATSVVEDGDERWVIGTEGEDGITWHPGGAPTELKYGNGTSSLVDRDGNILPRRIRVLAPDGVGVLFDSGGYAYDGARNITSIGGDEFRYDGVGRLTWSAVDGPDAVRYEIDYAFDLFGNMTDRVVNAPDPPDGLHFADRSYSDNRIADANYRHDANGNLVQEPTHDGTGGFNYGFTPENRLAYAQVFLGDGRIVQQGQYDAVGRRWVVLADDDGGEPLLTLRDRSGLVVAEYRQSAGAGEPELLEEYVRAAGQLVAVNSTCGPRPDLSLADPAKSGSEVMFVKNNNGVTSTSGYKVRIESESGAVKFLDRPADLPDTFGIPETEFFAGENNYVTIETLASCGPTGYSNAVMYHADPAPVGCLRETGAYRSGFGSDTSSLYVAVIDAGSSCSPGTLFNAYFQPEGSSSVLLLTPAPQTVPRVVFADQPLGAGQGRYWFVPVDGTTLEEGPPGPAVLVDAAAATRNAASAGGLASRTLSYVHVDHLGSTRLRTDEQGAVLEEVKFTPFGVELAGPAAGRMKFTGHERD